MTRRSDRRWRRARTRTLLTGAVLAALGALVVAPAASAKLTAVGPNIVVLNGSGDPQHMPAWFEDSNGVRVQPCLQGPPNCTGTPEGLFPVKGEAFYFNATAKMPTATGSAEVVQSLQFGYSGQASPQTSPGQESVFMRIRIRADLPTAGHYTVTYPYGQQSFDTQFGGLRAINSTVDIGCLGSPITGTCYDGVPPEFSDATKGDIGPFLRWDPAVAPAAPLGFLGDSATAHTVVGSPLTDASGNPQNYFEIDGPGVGGPGIDSVRTDLFTVQGQLWSSLAKPALDPQSDTGSSHSDGITKDATPVVTGTADPGTTAQLYVDGVADASAPVDANGDYAITANRLAEGDHQLAVTQVDPSNGSESAPSPRLNVTIDLTKPAPPWSLSATPQGGVPNPLIQGFSEFDTQISLYTDANCATTPAATGTSDDFLNTGLPVTVAQGDTVTFDATSTDAAGNVSDCSVDTVTYANFTPPTVSFTKTPADPTRVSATTIAFTASDAGSTFECSLDGDPFTSCTSPFSGPGLPDGQHTFDVRATDAAGHTGPAAEYAWTIDTVGPTVVLDTQPANPSTPSQTLNFSFHSPDGGTRFECDFGAATATPIFAPCTSPQSFAPHPAGTYRFDVRATDAAGNTGGAASDTFSVRSGTQPGISVAPASLDFGTQALGTTSTAQQVVVTNTGNANLVISGITKTGSTAFTQTNTCLAVTPLTPGETCTISVKFAAPKTAGALSASVSIGTNATPATTTVPIIGTAGTTAGGGGGGGSDTTPPTFTTAATAALTQGALTAAGTVPVKLSWAATDAAGVKYTVARSVNGGAFTNVALASTTAKTITQSLAVGSYQYRVTATDGSAAANAATSTVSVTVGLTQESSKNLVYAGTWSPATALAGASFGSVRFSSTSGSTVKMTFTGKAVAWVTSKGPDRGKATVTIDAGAATTVDTYASALAVRKEAFAKSGLAAGQHTITVRATGTKNANSKGARVDVDAFVVLG